MSEAKREALLRERIEGLEARIENQVLRRKLADALEGLSTLNADKGADPA